MPASEQERLQIELILATYDNVAVFPDDWATGDFEAEYLYRTDKLVVREDAVDRAIENSARPWGGPQPRRHRAGGRGPAGRDRVRRGRAVAPSGARRSSREELGEDRWASTGCSSSASTRCAAIEPEEPGTGAAAVPRVQDGAGRR